MALFDLNLVYEGPIATDVQASGENILAAVYSFTDVLASGQEELLGENNVFFDVLGCFMASF